MFKKFSFLLCLVFVLGIAGIGINAAKSRQTTPIAVSKTGSYAIYSGDSSVQIRRLNKSLGLLSPSTNIKASQC